MLLFHSDRQADRQRHYRQTESERWIDRRKGREGGERERKKKRERERERERERQRQRQRQRQRDRQRDRETDTGIWTRTES